MLEYYERKQEQERLLAMKAKDVCGGETMDKLFNETVEMIAKIYQKEPCGGALHIVIDDGNTEDTFIAWCLENSIREMEEGAEKALFRQCAINLIKLRTEKARGKAIYQAWKLFNQEFTKAQNSQ